MGCCSSARAEDSEPQVQIPRLKLTIVGPAAAGKTALARRFVMNAFSNEYKQDRLVDVAVKVIDAQDSIGMATLDVWTHPGEEDVPLPEAQQASDAWMIVVSANTSFLSESLQREYDAKVSPFLGTARVAGLPVPLCAVVTHMDEVDTKPEVFISLQESVLGWADDHGAMAAFVSCKTGTGVHKVFKQLAARALASAAARRAASAATGAAAAASPDDVAALDATQTGDSARAL